MHWCLIVVDMDSEEFIYLDSKSGEGRRSLTILSEYLQQEHLDKQAQRCSRPTAFPLVGTKGVLLMGTKGVLLMRNKGVQIMGNKGVLLMGTQGVLHM